MPSSSKFLQVPGSKRREADPPDRQNTYPAPKQPSTLHHSSQAHTASTSRSNSQSTTTSRAPTRAPSPHLPSHLSLLAPGGYQPHALSRLRHLLQINKHATFLVKLTIHEINNVPLVSGGFSVKWKFRGGKGSQELRTKSSHSSLGQMESAKASRTSILAGLTGKDSSSGAVPPPPPVTGHDRRHSGETVRSRLREHFEAGNTPESEEGLSASAFGSASTPISASSIQPQQSHHVRGMIPFPMTAISGSSSKDAMQQSNRSSESSSIITNASGATAGSQSTGWSLSSAPSSIYSRSRDSSTVTKSSLSGAGVVSELASNIVSPNLAESPTPLSPISLDDDVDFPSLSDEEREMITRGTDATPMPRDQSKRRARTNSIVTEFNRPRSKSTKIKGKGKLTAADGIGGGADDDSKHLTDLEEKTIEFPANSSLHRTGQTPTKPLIDHRVEWEFPVAQLVRMKINPAPARSSSPSANADNPCNRAAFHERTIEDDENHSASAPGLLGSGPKSESGLKLHIYRHTTPEGSAESASEEDDSKFAGDRGRGGEGDSDVDTTAVEGSGAPLVTKLKEVASHAHNHKPGFPFGVVELDLAQYACEEARMGKGGLTRRYLLKKGKTNATIKLTIELEQVSGERSYQTPPLQKGHVIAGLANFGAGDESVLDYRLPVIPSLASGSTTSISTSASHSSSRLPMSSDPSTPIPPHGASSISLISDRSSIHNRPPDAHFIKPNPGVPSSARKTNNIHSPIFGSLHLHHHHHHHHPTLPRHHAPGAGAGQYSQRAYLAPERIIEAIFNPSYSSTAGPFTRPYPRGVHAEEDINGNVIGREDDVHSIVSLPSPVASTRSRTGSDESVNVAKEQGSGNTLGSANHSPHSSHSRQHRMATKLKHVIGVA